MTGDFPDWVWGCHRCGGTSGPLSNYPYTYPLTNPVVTNPVVTHGGEMTGQEQETETSGIFIWNGPLVGKKYPRLKHFKIAFDCERCGKQTIVNKPFFGGLHLCWRWNDGR